MTGCEDKYSEENALLDIKISEDFELKKAIEKYYTLEEKYRKHILELINLFAEK